MLAARFRPAQTARMSDAVVDEGEWVKLHNELSSYSEDAGKANSFMVKHVNKKWEV